MVGSSSGSGNECPQDGKCQTLLSKWRRPLLRGRTTTPDLVKIDEIRDEVLEKRLDVAIKGECLTSAQYAII